ncbi:flagellar basal body-associated FliL family protein [Sphingomonas morindae]|uniref:Flagellar protein FliL n=1 Tax=Sphingomonas morindae TaxID=1541170 RepID=A0ABY4X9X5_9SPHN|nr:flagellar basal body-associated FliL family protein [Sphingomonas morindae]USI73718.1 flagellar basal body-associated FliL family protein [Sphingomonas morindae]
MSKDAKDKAAAPDAGAKKGGKKKLILTIVGALVLAGGGAAGGMFAAGMGGGGAHAKEPEVDPEAPKLVAREGQKAHPADQYKEIGSFAPDPKVYKPTYLTIEQNFTSNLRDTDGVVQLALSASTFYDQKVADAFKDNEMPIRSAILSVLADQDAIALQTPQGKDQLRAKLTDAINKVLVDKTGYGGVDNVYFSSFIIQ